MIKNIKMKLQIIIILISIAIEVSSQSTGTFIISLFDDGSKFKINQLDSVIFLNNNGQNIRFENVKSNDKKEFIFKSIPLGKNDVIFYKNGYDWLKNSYLIKSIPNQQISANLAKSIKKNIFDKYPLKIYETNRQYKDSTHKYRELSQMPNPGFNGKLEEFNYFVYTNIDSMLLKNNFIKKIEINFTVDGNGKVKLIEVIDRTGNSINPSVYNEIKRVFDLLPDWSGCDFIISKFSMIYQL